MNAIVNLKLSQLTVSPKNVRVVSAAKNADKELTASIRAKGILQNLVVIKADGEADSFEVVAGGRRFGALTNLLDAGEIDGDYQVPCSVREVDEATEISLGENIKADMHPADVFMAFKVLSDEGLSDKEIAERLGRSRAEVKRLLKLSTVAPELISHFRAGKLDLDSIMAFTVSDNVERQLACYAELSRGYFDSRKIKRYLLGEAISSTSREAKFIGVKAYKKAGGTITDDMFSDESFWNNPELIDQLIEDRLAEEAKKYENDWAWVETSRLGWQATNGTFPVEGEYVDVPAELDQEIAAVEAEIDAYNEVEEWTEEVEDAAHAMEEKLEALHAKRDTYIQFTPEQRAIAGVILTFDHSGELCVHEGMVKRADMSRLNEVEGTTTSDSVTAETVGVTPESRRIESNALLDDLDAYYAQAFQAHLIQHEATCFDLMLYSLAYQALRGHPDWNRLANVEVNTRHFTGVGIDDTKAAESFKEAELALSTSWLEISDSKERFTAFQALPKKEKMKLMAFSVARSTRTTIRIPSEAQALVAEQINFNLADYWLPNNENYFSRIKRDDLLTLGVQLAGEEFANRNAKAKKGELAEHLAKLPERGDWVPAAMAV